MSRAFPHRFAPAIAGRLALLTLAAVASCNRRPREAASDSTLVHSPALTPSHELGEAAKWRVGVHSYGPVHYGMSLQDASAALGEQLEPEPGSEYGVPGCFFTEPKSFPPRVSLMVIHDSVVRVDVHNAGIGTTDGARIGSTEDEIRRLYPGLVTTDAHPYSGPEWHILIMTSKDTADRFAIIFETDGHKVTSYSAGHMPEVFYAEGCE